MDTPIRPDEVAANTANPAGPILSFSTIGTGVLIAVAGVISGAQMARIADSLVGLVLVLIGISLGWRARKPSPPERVSDA